MSTIQRIPATEHVAGDTPLFDSLFGNLPQIVANGDTARARKRDPQPSHDGADISASTNTQVKATLYAIYREHPFGLTDEEAVRKFWTTDNIPACHIDTPRKRISDLEKEGLIVKTGRRTVSSSGVLVSVRMAVTL
jgi:hypothetical protein